LASLAWLKIVGSVIHGAYSTIEPGMAIDQVDQALLVEGDVICLN
jgi:hypothetical protein